MGTHPPRPLRFGAEPFTHGGGPDSSGGSYFADLFKELIVGVEEERQSWGKIVDIQATTHGRFDVLHAVAQRKSQLLDSGRTSFTYVVPGDRNTVPSRNMIHLMLDGVDHQLDGRLWRVDELILTVELFQNVVLQRSAEMVPRESLPTSHGEIHGPNHCCGPVDGLRDRDFVERNVGVQPLHVFDGVNGHTTPANLTSTQWII